MPRVLRAGRAHSMSHAVFLVLLLGTLLSGCGTVYTVLPRDTVSYSGKYAAGTIIVNTSQRRLYLVKQDGRAIVYPIGVGEEGRSWSGVSTVSAKREWPDWSPTDEMRRRKPGLPVHMVGGTQNPMGARALYLGSSVYRIHGTNEPWTVGTAASSGCIRMYNHDVVDLYEQTRIGATVIVQR